ncbi:MAG: hypothetical protein IPK16_30530 [Anaerolineales bacterium]|nr:hypothetical protein [Anaerolineales bacterium]
MNVAPTTAWEAPWLRGQLTQGAWDLISISAHARHDAFRSPQPGEVQASDLAEASNSPAALLYSLGCQAGLNVPPGAPGEVDWPQAAARRGMNFVGNTGWGTV